MLRIATDLDETLCDIMTPFKNVLMKRHNARVIEEPGYQIKTSPEISYDEIWDIFKYLYQAHVMIDPYPGAGTYLNRIYQLTRKPPLIITARPEGYEGHTHDLVRSIAGDTPVHLIIVGKDSKNKMLYTDHFDILVEDKLETLITLAEDRSKHGILVRRYYNRAFEGSDNQIATWLLENKIAEVGGVHEITPFLQLLLNS